MNLFKKILIANRSEVALRLQSTCHALGIQTVAIFSPEDRQSSFVRSATQAYCIPKSGYSAYLDQDAIIAIAVKSGADAIHPGYGFLSENALFAQKVVDAGLQWIGPSPRAIALMADKVAARTMMQQAGVPVVPGISISDFSESHIAYIKTHIAVLGYPVIIKDPRGGGGKAMRRVDHEKDFESAIQSVLSEAKKLTGSAELLIEKYIQKGRHIEVQIAGDGKDYIHLFERECSLQRRHQKIIEETPCAFVSQQTLSAMYQAALVAARAVDYDNIGTVEFIVTTDQDFYFLEMNTRLQVEHAVTELTTRIDLVALQIRLAAQKVLPLKQEDVMRQGHAIECRLYTEDTDAHFRPATGTIKQWHLPVQHNIRIEHDIRQGSEITPFFDPMIAKFTAYGATRNESVARLVAFLRHSVIDGVKTNKDFLRAIMQSEEFMTGAVHTQLVTEPSFLQRMQQVESPVVSDQEAIVACIAVLVAEQLQKKSAKKVVMPSVCQSAVHRRWKDQQWR
jgi:acetyl/propionyl-CoA carboxylase alpha subunit